MYDILYDIYSRKDLSLQIRGGNMRLLKMAKIMIVAAAAVFALSVNSYAGAWLHDSNGWWYRNDDRSYTTNNWQKINGFWYYFNPWGYMETGWKQIRGSWYYLHADGKMAHDTWIDGTYYVGSDGRMLTNTTTPDGYRVGADGKWVRNSQKKLSREQVETVFQRYWEDEGLSSSYAISYWDIERMTDRYAYIHERWYTGSHGEATIDLYTGDCIETGPYESPGEPYSGIPLETKYLFNAWTY